MSEQEQEQTQEPETQEQDGPEPEAPVTLEEAAEEEEAASEEVEGQEGEAESEPEQPQGVSEKQIEQVFKKFEKSSRVWRDRVATIMGGDAEVLLPCPLCDANIPGYVMPSPDVPDRFPAVREFMGDAQPADYQQDPNTRTCKTCAGEGVVETGSRVEDQKLLVCTDCGGKGWQGARPAVAASGPMAAQPPPDVNGQAEPTRQGPEPPEAAKLRALGYTLIQPVGAS